MSSKREESAAFRVMYTIFALILFAGAASAYSIDHYYTCDEWRMGSRYSSDTCLKSHEVKGPNVLGAITFASMGAVSLYAALRSS